MIAGYSRARGRLGFRPESNYQAFLGRLAEAGAASRSDLATDLDISAASVGRIADRLLAANLIVEGERVVAGVGRPRTLLHVNSSAGLVAGVSIRAKSMRLRLTDLDGAVIDRVRIDRSNVSAAAIADQLRNLITSSQKARASNVPLAAVIVGISGVWNPVDRQVCAAPNLSVLEGVDVESLFTDALDGVLLSGGLRVDNDINFAALGEWEGGAARNIDDFFYLSLGSGVGGAAVISGSPYGGPYGFTGELGYLPVYSQGELRQLEDVVGRRALEQFTAGLGFELGEGDVFEYLANHASDEDVVAQHVSDVLGQALVSVVTTLNPRLIVLGGGVGRYGEVWVERIRKRLASFVPVAPRIVSTELGREASLLGAVGLGRVVARRTLLNKELKNSWHR